MSACTLYYLQTATTTVIEWEKSASKHASLRSICVHERRFWQHKHLPEGDGTQNGDTNSACAVEKGHKGTHTHGEGNKIYWMREGRDGWKGRGTEGVFTGQRVES